jgi:superfamily I DNA/RNA helicase
MILANTFQESLARLTNNERSAVSLALLQYLADPTHPSLSVHQIDRVADKRFRSFRASLDLRVIVHLLDGESLICYAGHHDDAYEWARRRQIVSHPTTGSVSIVVIPEVAQPPVSQVRRPNPQQTPALFGHLPDDILLRCGLTNEQLPYVRAVCDEDALLALCAVLPGEVAELLLNAYGGELPPVPVVEPVADPFRHPDTLRRFMTVTSRAELEAALSDRWESWTVFLHPEQRRLVQRTYAGPARVAGSAGTGKTVVALHRAARMAELHPGERILLTTLSDALAAALARKLNILLATDPRRREQIEVVSLDTLVTQIARQQQIPPALPLDSALLEKLVRVEHDPASRFTVSFILSEWLRIVDPWQLNDWESYRDFKRHGRMRRLNVDARAAVWQSIARIHARLTTAGVRTSAGLYATVTKQIGAQPSRYAGVVVDECQDLTPYQLRFLAALMHDRLAGLYFAGDSGQQIFQQPFSWKSIGVDIVGRSALLKVNYRTSHQIRRLADTLLDDSIVDVDGNPELRTGTHSVFSGPQPVVHVAATVIAEAEYVGAWIATRHAHGIPSHEIALIVRSSEQLERARAAAQVAKVAFVVLDERLAVKTGHVSILTMHLAKGLEFRSVAVMACDEGILPDNSRFFSDDPAELNAINDSERQLLYVAMTRARDELVLSAAGTPSEYLVDLEEMAARGKL